MKKKCKSTIFIRYKFAKDQITFDIPLTDPELQAVSKKVRKVPMTPTPVFTPIRIVDNISITEVGKPRKYIKRLPRKVRIKVRYTPAVLKKAGGKPLVLAIWGKKQWVLLNNPYFNYHLVASANPKRGGYAMLTTKKWWDPPMVWGTRFLS